MILDIKNENNLGDLFAFLGPNGAGKSVLLKTINGLVPISKGKITFNSQETSEAIRKKQAMVFQSPTLLRRTVLHNMEFINSINKETNILDAKFEEIMLYNFYNHPARLLSGGEKQRLSLARALLLKPKLLLLDEPTTNLEWFFKVNRRSDIRRKYQRNNYYLNYS